MPVSYRVWVSGFADDERLELRQLFVQRSLIAYQAADTPHAAEIMIVDADQPQTFAELGHDLVPGHALYIGHSLPPQARWHLPRPLMPGLVLRMLDELVARERPAPHRYRDAFETLIGEGLAFALSGAPPRRSSTHDQPALSSLGALDFVAGEVAVAAPGQADVRRLASPAAHQPAGAIRLRPAAVERRSSKQRHRGAVRRSRQARVSPSKDADLRALVVEGHPLTRLETGVLLQAFGFRAHTVASVAEAERALWTQAYAVAFVGDPSDGPAERAGIELCHRIKQGSYGQPDQPLPKVVMLAQHPRPADPVRARLAGCDHFVSGPATRGTLALALDAIDLPMPRDPRVPA